MMMLMRRGRASTVACAVSLALVFCCCCLFSRVATAFFFESRSLYRSAVEVVDVTDTNLSALHEWAYACPWILVAYAGGCGHCRVAAPFIARVAAETYANTGDVLNDVSIAALNCETSTSGCRELGVRGVPAFYFIFPSTMQVSEPTMSPIVVSVRGTGADDGNATARMARVFIGQGSRLTSHFDNARHVWGGATTNVWDAAKKERCFSMRAYLRQLKQSETADVGTQTTHPGSGGAGTFTEDTVFHEVDVANAFFHTLHHEVALVGLQSAAQRFALFQFLRAVQLRLPGLGADVLLHSMAGNARSGSAAHPRSPADFASLSVEEWQRLVLSAGIPYRGTPRELRWQTCRGSSWRHRGFPCGMWLLYHALTANGANDNGASRDEILHIILDYARHFFACEACRTHFLAFRPVDDADPVLQLWRFHNSVNRRLMEVTDGADPLVPKRSFPSPEQCPSCYRDAPDDGAADSRFVVAEVSAYLLKRYRWTPTALYPTTSPAANPTPADPAEEQAQAITVYRNPMGANVLLTIVVVVMAAVLGMVHVLRRARSVGAKRRRTALPLRMKM